MKRFVVVLLIVALVLTFAGVGGFVAVLLVRKHFFFPISIDEMLRLQEKGEDAAPETPRLLACFDRDNEALRLNAAMTLGTIGPKAVDPVRERLSDPNPRVRFAAVEALGFIGQPAAGAAHDLVARLQDEDPNVRRKTVYVLARLETKSPAVAEGIINALADKNADVAEQALEAVKNMGAPPKEALPALTKLAGHDKQQMRVEAIKLLGKMGEPAMPALRKILVDAPADESGMLFLTIVPLGAKAQPLLPELQAIMSKNKWWDGEDELFMILKSCGADGAATIANVIKTVHDPMSPHFDVGDDRARTLLKVIGEIGPQAKGTTPLVIEVLTDRPSLRIATLDALGDIGPSAKNAVPAVEALANDVNVGLQARVALKRMSVVAKQAGD